VLVGESDLARVLAALDTPAQSAQPAEPEPAPVPAGPDDAGEA
jgi:hypothetical protein